MIGINQVEVFDIQLFFLLKFSFDLDQDFVAGQKSWHPGRIVSRHDNDQLAATVIFYGSPITDPLVLRSLPGPVLGIFGGADNSIPLDDVQAFEAALNQADIPNEISIYDGQPHAFVTDIESIRLGGVQGQAWAQMLDFFETNLKQGGASHNANPPQTYRDSLNLEYYLIVAFEHAVGTASHHPRNP